MLENNFSFLIFHSISCPSSRPFQVEIFHIYFFRHSSYVGRSLATQKNIFAFETKEDLYNTSNYSLSQEFQYMVRVTRVLRDFHLRWAELKDFLVTMSVMTDISGYKAKVEKTYIYCLMFIVLFRHFNGITRRPTRCTLTKISTRFFKIQ